MKNALQEIVSLMDKGKIRNKKELELEKIRLAKKYHMSDLIKNADIVIYLEKENKLNEKYLRLLKTKPVRTFSGVANIAVMWMDKKSCPGKCIYCPDVVHKGKRIPKSYTGVEPTTMRALRFNFSPALQIKNRLMQLSVTGHNTDKCELIVMGGTFLSANKSFQEKFIKECFDAFNGFPSSSLKEAQRNNENANHRCVGLTIETRADYCSEKEIKQMLKLGCTRVEIGVQTTDPYIMKKINRGHGIRENIKAIERLKKAGLKVCIHFMPGLTGLTKLDLKKELSMFKKLFSPEYRPDELKIYPTLVVPGSKLYDLWKQGKYEPLTISQMSSLLVEMKKIIPKYVRIKRIMRDISEKKVVAGPKTTNLRQLILEEMKRKHIKCRCIRCRQPWGNEPLNPVFMRYEYNASHGKEIFLSFEDKKNDVLVAFLRLRIDNDDTAKVRELHVYGEAVPINKKIKNAYQHKSYGRLLLQRAEAIAQKYGKKTISVTSGVGVRNYYRKFGYKLKGFYMVKNL